MTSPRQIATEWLAAFNAHDLERLLCIYDDEAVHYSPKLKQRRPETGGLIKGKAAMRSWWADALKRLPGLHYELVRLTADYDRVFMEYTRKVAGDEDVAVAEILEIRNQLIIASRVYHG